MYYLAICGSEGWELRSYDTIDYMLSDIVNGGTRGNEFKIFKELELKIQED